MKNLLSVLALFISIPGFSADPLPTYLKSLKGVVVNDLVKTSPFEFTPGTLKTCVRKEVVDTVLFDCSVDGTSATVKDGADARTFEFTSVRAWFRHTTAIGNFAEYTFVGHYRGIADTTALTSPVRMVLWYAKTAPDRVKGYLELTDYGVSRPIQAAP